MNRPGIMNDTKLVPLDHIQFVAADPEHVKALIMNMHMHNDADLIRADEVLGKIVMDRREVEKSYKEPVAFAHKQHKNLTGERKDHLEKYEWAETLLKEKMKQYNMERDRKALEEPEVTTTSMSPPELRSRLKHTTFVPKWKYKITDPEKLPRKYLIPDAAAIGKIVNAMGEAACIPGVTVYRDDIVRVNT